MIQYKIAQDLEHGEDWKFLRIWFSRGRQGLETHPTNRQPRGSVAGGHGTHSEQQGEEHL